jgi:hypothetical protein
MIIYGGMLAAYLVLVLIVMVNGAVYETLGIGHKRHARAMRTMWRYHTGLHFSRSGSYGDEAKLKRTAGASNRATPDGRIVYYARWNRPRRALRNNLIVLLVLAWMYGMVLDTQLTVQVATVAATLAFFGGIVLLIRRARNKRLANLPAVLENARVLQLELKHQKGIPVTAERGATSLALLEQAQLEGPPKLRTGVATPVLATLLSGELGISPAEVAVRLKLSPDRGSVNLPDTFAALQRQRDVIEEIVAATMKGKVAFTWETTLTPRVVSWRPVVSNLPTTVKFRDYLAAAEACQRRDFAQGVKIDGNVYVNSHRGENSWHCMSMGSGTGKSTRFLLKAVQIHRADPKAHIYCVDTKQVSFEPLKKLDSPRIHIYDDPESHMGDIYDVFYVLESLLRERYSSVRRGESRLDDYDDVWLLVDEGNDLATQIKIYWQNKLKRPGDPAAPPVWSEAIATLINLGRQANMFGEFMFQNMTDRALGGVSLRDAFGIYGMAGYTKNQWSRIIGTTPMPECKNGPGRIMMVRGTEQDWVQGFVDDDEFLLAYAMGRV